jgi:hypothetical protein
MFKAINARQFRGPPGLSLDADPHETLRYCLDPFHAISRFSFDCTSAQCLLYG